MFNHLTNKHAATINARETSFEMGRKLVTDVTIYNVKKSDIKFDINTAKLLFHNLYICVIKIVRDKPFYISAQNSFAPLIPTQYRSRIVLEPA